MLSKSMHISESAFSMSINESHEDFSDDVFLEYFAIYCAIYKTISM